VSQRVCDSGSQTGSETGSETVCDTGSQTGSETGSVTVCDTGSQTVCETGVGRAGSGEICEWRAGGVLQKLLENRLDYPFLPLDSAWPWC